MEINGVADGFGVLGVGVEGSSLAASVFRRATFPEGSGEGERHPLGKPRTLSLKPKPWTLNLRPVDGPCQASEADGEGGRGRHRSRISSFGLRVQGLSFRTACQEGCQRTACNRPL